MSAVALIFVRLAAVVAGYACAALAASATLHLAWLGVTGIDPDQAPLLVAGSITVSIPFVALFVAYFAFVPAMIAIGIAEFAGWRDWLFHALSGAVIAAVVMYRFWVARPEDLALEGQDMPQAGAAQFDDPQVLAALLAAGLVAGIVYWLVAGRGSGGWRRASVVRTPPSP